jgi:NitT/TauT family transport system substrate-binding protein
MAIAVLANLVIGCGKAPVEDGQPIVYRLKWLYNASVAGSLYAQSHGFFREKGLDVTIKQGGPERDAIKELELGHAQFGVASADQVIRAVSKGSPIVVIAQLFQHNPLQWMYRPEKTPLKTAQDLKGKIIGVTFGGNDETIMRALMAKHAIPQSEVTLFSVRYDYTPFYDGRVDLWPVYQNTQGVVIGDRMEKTGESVRFFNPSAFGIRFVANSVITTKRMMSQHAKTVAHFTEALLAGWREVLKPTNEDRAVETIRLFDRDTPVAIMKKQLAATRMLIQPEQGTIGTIDERAWVQTEKIMREQALIAQPVPIRERLGAGETIKAP